jgi:hypothetical protein
MPDTQVTVISLYGEKKREFATLIAQCQQTVTEAVGNAFQPYKTEQIHATVIGLERQSGTALGNRNFAGFRNRSLAMNLDGFRRYLCECGHLPFEVQIGGFQDRQYPFTSRKLRPFDRSFSIQGDKVVVMGWPIRGEPVSIPPTAPEAFMHENRIYPPTLDEIRHAAQSFGILHSWHRTVTDVDNDLFFRIGLIDPKSLPLGAVRTLEQRIREHLASERPLIFEITSKDIFIAAYQDDTLPLSSTRVWPITDPEIDGGFVSGLYKS